MAEIIPFRPPPLSPRPRPVLEAPPAFIPPHLVGHEVAPGMIEFREWSDCGFPPETVKRSAVAHNEFIFRRWQEDRGIRLGPIVSVRFAFNRHLGRAVVMIRRPIVEGRL